MNIIGRRIGQLRREKHMAQFELEHDTGVKNISDIEAGNAHISTTIDLLDIAAALNVHPNRIVGGLLTSDEQESLSSEWWQYRQADQKGHFKSANLAYKNIDNIILVALGREKSDAFLLQSDETTNAPDEAIKEKLLAILGKLDAERQGILLRHAEELYINQLYNYPKGS